MTEAIYAPILFGTYLSGRPFPSYIPALAGLAGSGVLREEREVPLASPPMRYWGGLRMLCDPAMKNTEQIQPRDTWIKQEQEIGFSNFVCVCVCDDKMGDEQLWVSISSVQDFRFNLSHRGFYFPRASFPYCCPLMISP